MPAAPHPRIPTHSLSRSPSAASHKDPKISASRAALRTCAREQPFVPTQCHCRRAPGAINLHRPVPTFATTRSSGYAWVDEVTDCIRDRIGFGYSWPDHVRGLKQCVRNVLIRGEFAPPRESTVSVTNGIARKVVTGSLTLDRVTRPSFARSARRSPRGRRRRRFLNERR